MNPSLPTWTDLAFTALLRLILIVGIMVGVAGVWILVKEALTESSDLVYDTIAPELRVADRQPESIRRMMYIAIPWRPERLVPGQETIVLTGVYDPERKTVAEFQHQMRELGYTVQVETHTETFPGPHCEWEVFKNVDTGIEAGFERSRCKKRQSKEYWEDYPVTKNYGTGYVTVQARISWCGKSWLCEFQNLFRATGEMQMDGILPATVIAAVVVIALSRVRNENAVGWLLAILALCVMIIVFWLVVWVLHVLIVVFWLIVRVLHNHIIIWVPLVLVAFLLAWYIARRVLITVVTKWKHRTRHERTATYPLASEVIPQLMKSAIISSRNGEPHVLASVTIIGKSEAVIRETIRQLRILDYKVTSRSRDGNNTVLTVEW
jgi:hypothetical protein